MRKRVKYQKEKEKIRMKECRERVNEGKIGKNKKPSRKNKMKKEKLVSMIYTYSI